jgi:putative spermidine/putrescine transport system ATP-binding protein
VTVVSGGETPVVSLGETHLSAHSETQFAGGQAVQLAVRPENVVIDPPVDYVRLRAIVTSETYQGPIIRYRADVAGQEITIERQNQAGLVRYASGAEITIGWAPQRSSLLPIE